MASAGPGGRFGVYEVHIMMPVLSTVTPAGPLLVTVDSPADQRVRFRWKICLEFKVES